ncbi:hypothetical protein BDP27DRAFT_1366594 [Rhodocollybia butyracea]|uniref:F-box domain-containing protein n=1 Tax=Rhodocollybia butyracea TaxID=206335 RepID=A0A9P5PL64_9AGAR|nr:hypothetical protein BDP27DRAFT_1366594 [Rhodocollybia butyracea]
MPRSSCGGNTFIPRVPVELPRLHNRLRAGSGPVSVMNSPQSSKTLNGDLEDYAAEISRLGQEKERLERYATQLWSLNSPFRKVPDDILRHIFNNSGDSMNGFQVVNLECRLPMDTSQALMSKPAMVISSVCSRWRRNVLSMPALWSRVSLYLRWILRATLFRVEYLVYSFQLMLEDIDQAVLGRRLKFGQHVEIRDKSRGKRKGKNVKYKIVYSRNRLSRNEKVTLTVWEHRIAHRREVEFGDESLRNQGIGVWRMEIEWDSKRRIWKNGILERVYLRLRPLKFQPPHPQPRCILHLIYPGRRARIPASVQQKLYQTLATATSVTGCCLRARVVEVVEMWAFVGKTKR